jgi:hypothetical protein
MFSIVSSRNSFAIAPESIPASPLYFTIILQVGDFFLDWRCQREKILESGAFLRVAMKN